MKVKISAVITCISGEENYLSTCLASLKNFADEIVIVDMSAGKEISEVGKKFRAKIYSHEFVNYVEPVRNFGITKATGDFVLILDPDEEISLTLARRLIQIAQENNIDYVRIPRKNIVFGKALYHSRWWPDYNIRFFRKGKVSWDEVIHSVPMTEGDGIDLEAEDEFSIIHHHYESVEQFIERMNRYTTVQAKLKSEGYVFDWRDVITRPAGEFLSRFFAGEGYRDGIHGLALSGLQAISELVVYLKVWDLQKFVDGKIKVDDVIDELGKTRREFIYWENDVKVKESGSFVAKIRRELRW